MNYRSPNGGSVGMYKDLSVFEGTPRAQVAAVLGVPESELLPIMFLRKSIKSGWHYWMTGWATEGASKFTMDGRVLDKSDLFQVVSIEYVPRSVISSMWHDGSVGMRCVVCNSSAPIYKVGKSLFCAKHKEDAKRMGSVCSGKRDSRVVTRKQFTSQDPLEAKANKLRAPGKGLTL